VENTSFYFSEKAPKVAKKEVLDLIMDNILNDVEIDPELNYKSSTIVKNSMEKKIQKPKPKTRSNKRRSTSGGKSSMKKRELK